MANIDVRDEDETYELCYRINQDYAGTDGKNLLDNIYSLSDELSRKWRGPAAVVHIDHLYEVYSNMCTLLSLCKRISYVAGMAIRDLREREIRAFAPVEPLTKHIDEDQYIVKEGFNVDSTGFGYQSEENDTALTRLSSVCTSFDTLINNIRTAKNNLFDYWIAGENRNTHEEVLSTFLKRSDEFSGYLTNAKDALQSANETFAPVAD